MKEILRNAQNDVQKEPLQTHLFSIRVGARCEELVGHIRERVDGACLCDFCHELWEEERGEKESFLQIQEEKE